MSIRLQHAVVADEALVSIVRGAVAAVEGVRLDRPGRVSRALPGRRDAVTWVVDEDGVSFDLDVAASYGVILPRAAEAVRASVGGVVTGMTGLRVRKIDITVTGVER
jgi:uncharacterized alkaline shock family protein YloU